MSEMQQSRMQQPRSVGVEAAAALAEIQLRQGRVVRAVLVPVWYWWTMAAGMVAIGAARDSGEPGVQVIGYAAGAVVLVIAGPLVNRYLRRLMVSRVRQPVTDATATGRSTA